MWLTVAQDDKPIAIVIPVGTVVRGRKEIQLDSGQSRYSQDWVFNYSNNNEWFTTSGGSSPTTVWKRLAKDEIRLMARMSDDHSVAFSPDNKWMATSSYRVPKFYTGPGDESLTRLWRLSQGSISFINLLAGGVPYFDEDSSRLIVEGKKGIHSWTLSSTELLEMAQAAAGRNFTWEEWNREFPGRAYQKTFSNLPVHMSVIEAMLKQAESASSDSAPSNAAAVYRSLTAFVIDSGNPYIASEICWSGLLNGFADIVFPAGEYAAQQRPADGNILDTRGLARALVGDKGGAIADFRKYVDWAISNNVDPSEVQKRLAWIRSLESGRMPFNKGTLAELRNRE